MELNLQPNEGVIIQSTGVHHGGMMAGYTDELLLTNLNVIYVKRGVFGGVKSIQKFPVDQIKIINGQVQAIAGKNPINNCPQLQIYFKNGQETFEFQTSARKKITMWINSINQLLAETDVTSNTFDNIDEAPPVVEAFRETIDTFKNAFGLEGTKTKNVGTTENIAFKTGNDRTTENITIKCMGCRAPISGVKGQRVRCKYCDTEQTL